MKIPENSHQFKWVFNKSLLISKNENVNTFIVSLGALLHDIADNKFTKGEETVGLKVT